MNVRTHSSVGSASSSRSEEGANLFVTELISNALNSAASQMKRTLVRTAYSPIIYEALDFAVVLYDKNLRLLAQAQSIPIFMGAMNFCIEASVEAVGGASELAPGDVILYNWPYGTGTHAQDASITMPVFVDDELVGYAACKAHWMDIGAKDPYCTDTVDVFQEGVFFPGVKIQRRGEWNMDIVRMAKANTRIPEATLGDINAQIACCRVGADELVRVVRRFGREEFEKSVERMLDHGEAMIRSYLNKIPDGQYVATGRMDDNGVEKDTIEFDVSLSVEGSEIQVDFSKAPPAAVGPTNCPLPSTVAGARVLMIMLADAMEHLNEGHYRPIKVITKPGTMFHPLPPSPCFLFGWPLVAAMEGLLRAIGDAVPEAVPGRSGGCILTLIWWGKREESGEVWAAGSPLPIGQGGHINGDGGTMLHMGMAFSQVPPIELWEAKFPWLIETYELAQDSCGPGRNIGGQGIHIVWRTLEDCTLTSTIEQTKSPAWGVDGGGDAQANRATLTLPDGTMRHFGKITGLKAPKGSLISVRSGGGGGYGSATDRDPAAVRSDLRNGYISEAFARQHFPQAFSEQGAK